MSFAERVRRTLDSIAMNVAYHMPKRLRTWATIHSINETASRLPNKIVGSITVDDIMKGTN